MLFDLNFNCKCIQPVICQVRYPVLLTPNEKQMAREVCIAFRQSVSPKPIGIISNGIHAIYRVLKFLQYMQLLFILFGLSELCFIHI